MLWVKLAVQVGDWLHCKDPATIKTDLVVACSDYVLGFVFVYMLDDRGPTTVGACPWVERQHRDLQASRRQFWDDPPESHVEVAAQKVDIVGAENPGQVVQEMLVRGGETSVLFRRIVL